MLRKVTARNCGEVRGLSWEDLDVHEDNMPEET